MERWTRIVIRRRWPVLAAWTIVLAGGFYGFSKLSALQSDKLTVPATDLERGRTGPSRRFGDPSDGSFTVVFQGRAAAVPAVQERLQSLVDRAARAVPTAHATALHPGSPTDRQSV